MWLIGIWNFGWYWMMDKENRKWISDKNVLFKIRKWFVRINKNWKICIGKIIVWKYMIDDKKKLYKELKE